MDHDTCIITVSCVVEAQYRPLTAACPIWHGGFVPQLRDVEGITLAIGGEFFKLARATELLAYCRAPYRSFCPALTERTFCGRQAANLWQRQATIQGSLPICPST